MFCLHWGGSESPGYLGQEESPPADNRDQGRGLPALLRVLWVSVSNEEQHGEEGIAGWLTGASILVDRHPASPWRLTVHLPQPCSCKSLCSWWGGRLSYKMRFLSQVRHVLPVWWRGVHPSAGLHGSRRAHPVAVFDLRCDHPEVGRHLRQRQLEQTTARWHHPTLVRPPTSGVSSVDNYLSSRFLPNGW